MMTEKRRAWACCCAALLCLPALAAGEQLTCTVTVVDTAARPVAGAEVVVYEKVTDWTTTLEEPVVLFGPETTGPDGRVQARIDCGSMGRVMVVAHKDGQALGWDVLPYEDTAAPTLHLILDRPMPFAGRVLDAAGRPVAGAKVLAQPKISKMDRLDQTPVLAPEAWMTARTDADGRFRLDCFGEDVRCDFFVTAAGSETTHHFTPYYMTSIGYVIGDEEVELRLPEETTIAGQVVDEEGRGIEGMGVHIRRDHRDEMRHKHNYVPRHAVADAEGRFAFEAMPKAGHLLSVRNTDVSRPWAGKTLIVDGTGDERVGELMIPLEAGGVMEVTLIDEASQKPIEGITAAFIREPANEKEWWSYRYVSTDAKGRVKVVLPAGAVRFSCWNDRYQRNEELKLPEVKGGQSSAVRFELTPHPVLTGMVKDTEGKAAPGAAVRLLQGPQVLTDGQGRFRIPADRISEGACLVARDVERNLAGMVPAGDPATTKALELKPARTVRGMITDTAEAPVAAARVAIDFRWPGYLSRLSEEVLTDAEGKFEVRAIPGNLPEDSELRMTVVTMNHGCISYGRLSIQREDGERIELTPLRMHPADQTVSGTVVDADGKPVAGLPIYLNDNKQYSHTVVTDAKGRFVMRRLCEGKIRLQAGIGGTPGHVTANAGDREIKAVMGQDLVHVPQVSIAGKPLGDLTAHGVQLPADANSVALFVWDVDQRSSRHFAKAFAQKAAMLKEKGLAAVLLQATPTDRVKLEAWLKDNEIDCPCGMIKGDADAVAFKMGVQGLPWLILTDGEGKVVAEGISVEELEKRLASQ